MTTIDLFNNNFIFNDKKVIIIFDEYNKIWFKAKNICNILEYKNLKETIKNFVYSDDKKIINPKKKLPYVNLTDEEKKGIFINESGVYSLLLKSTKKESKIFKLWFEKDLKKEIEYVRYHLKKNIKIDMFEFVLNNTDEDIIKLSDKNLINEFFEYYNLKKILITPSILNFLNFNKKCVNIVELNNIINKIDETNIRSITISEAYISCIEKEFIKHLDKNNIRYEKFNFEDKKCSVFDIVKYKVNNYHDYDEKLRNLKKWLVLDFDDFKKSIMKLDSEIEKNTNIKNYFLKLENAINKYKYYLKNYKYLKIKKKRKLKKLKKIIQIKKIKKIEKYEIVSIIKNIQYLKKNNQVIDLNKYYKKKIYDYNKSDNSLYDFYELFKNYKLLKNYELIKKFNIYIKKYIKNIINRKEIFNYLENNDFIIKGLENKIYIKILKYQKSLFFLKNYYNI